MTNYIQFRTVVKQDLGGRFYFNVKKNLTRKDFHGDHSLVNTEVFPQYLKKHYLEKGLPASILTQEGKVQSQKHQHTKLQQTSPS